MLQRGMKRKRKRGREGGKRRGREILIEIEGEGDISRGFDWRESTKYYSSNSNDARLALQYIYA